MRSFLVLVLTAVVGLGVAAPAFAVPLHQHFLTTPGTTVELAQGFCRNDPHGAFENFHGNVHTGTPGTFAFDQEGNPVDISAGACP